MKHILRSLMAAAIVAPVIVSAQTSHNQNTATTPVPAGLSNTAYGINSLNGTTTGANNTGVGLFTLNSNTSGNHNTATGHYALMTNTTGMYNAAHGMNALRFNTTGNFNTANGSTALYNNTSGIHNTANGYESMRQNTTGNYNAANGYWSLYNNTSGNYNTAEGYKAMLTNTTGSYNTALGSGADVSANNLTNATVIGSNAIVTQSNNMILGDNRVFVGIGLSGGAPANKLEIDAGLNGMLASLNGGAGASGLRLRDLHLGNTPSASNGVALSVDANGDVILVPASTGGAGLGGACPSTNLLTGDYEVPLNNWNINFTTPPSSNKGQVIIGTPTNSCPSFNARLNVFDDFIGEGIYGYSATTWGTNQVGVHGNAFNGTGGTGSAAIGVLGETNGYSTATPTELYAGVAGFCGTPTYALMPQGVAIGVYGNSVSNWGTWAGYFDGDVNINGTGYITSGFWLMSDRRYKKDIQPLENVTDKLKALNSYTYNYRKDEFKEKNFDDKKHLGFIAQELKELFPELVREDAKGFYSVNYEGMVPVLTEAFREQQQQIEKQNETIGQQQKQIDELKSMVMSLAGNTSSSSRNVSLSDKNTIVLDQNVPNPFAESTVITYNIPVSFTKAQVLFTNNEGKLVKAVDITSSGEGRLNVFASDLSSGMYNYTLVVDGKTIDTRKMVKQ